MNPPRAILPPVSWHRQGHWQILAALIAAIATGVALKWAGPDAPVAPALLRVCALLGGLFMAALKMIIVPVVVTSIICGIGSAGALPGFGRLGLKTLAFYGITTFIACLTGLAMVNAIQPGLDDGEPNLILKAAITSEAGKLATTGGSDAVLDKVAESQDSVLATLENMLVRMVPDNVIAAAAKGDMLGLITFTLLFGFAMAVCDGPAIMRVREVFVGLNEIILRVTGWIMACAPAGVFALVTPVIATTGGGIFKALGWYFLTVVGGLGIHMFLTMPVLLMVLGGLSPRRHFSAMRDALLTAFSTASSNATLPVTMRCVVANAGVSRRVAGFTLPMGATVNMDGTALYECVAVLFVAQVLGIDLSAATQFTVAILALLTSIGVAGVPSASLVAIVIIMQSVKIEGAGAAIAVLFSVDRLLDMSRTAVNIFGDSCGAVIIARTEGEGVLGLMAKAPASDGVDGPA